MRGVRPYFSDISDFSGDLDESKTLSNIQWGTGIKEASKETLGTAAEKAQT